LPIGPSQSTAYRARGSSLDETIYFDGTAFLDIADRALRVVLERVSGPGVDDLPGGGDIGRRSVARIGDVETASLLLDLRDLRSSRGDVATGCSPV